MQTPSINRPFLSCLKSLFQREGKCKVTDMKMIFYSRANKTHFYKIGFTLTFCKLVYKVKVFGIWIWPTCSAKAVLKKKKQIGIRQCTVADMQLTQLQCTLYIQLNSIHSPLNSQSLSSFKKKLKMKLLSKYENSS